MSVWRYGLVKLHSWVSNSFAMSCEKTPEWNSGQHGCVSDCTHSFLSTALHLPNDKQETHEAALIKMNTFECTVNTPYICLTPSWPSLLTLEMNEWMNDWMNCCWLGRRSAVTGRFLLLFSHSALGVQGRRRLLDQLQTHGSVITGGSHRVVADRGMLFQAPPESRY